MPIGVTRHRTATTTRKFSPGGNTTALDPLSRLGAKPQRAVPWA